MILAIASGINIRHPKCINWSYLNLGIVHLTHIYTKMKNNIFTNNTENVMSDSAQSGTMAATVSIPGKLYPPKYNVAIIADEINICTYSEKR